MKEIFYKAIAERRVATEHEDDMLQTLIESTYKLVDYFHCLLGCAFFLKIMVRVVKLYLILLLYNRDGRHLDDEEIAGMMIGLLMAGQHTSSTTSAWLGFFLARQKELQV